jgi:replication factor C subunit 3/5
MIAAKWCDDQRPSCFSQLTFHSELNTSLKKLTANMPHIILYGSAGAGKLTRAHCILKELYKEVNFRRQWITVPETRTAENKISGVGEKRKDDQEEDTKTVACTFQMFIIESDYHVEVTPSDADHKDVHVIRFLTKRIDVISERIGDEKIKPKFKLFIINQAHLLSHVAQCAMRRIMESKSSHIRFVILSESLSSIMEPLRSRCVCFRVALPSEPEVATFVREFTRTKCPTMTDNMSFYTRIAVMASRNVSFALTLAEGYSQSFMEWRRDKNKEDHVPPPPLLYPEWMQSCFGIMDRIVSVCKEGLPTGNDRMQWRKAVYDLLEHCIPPSEIVRNMLHRLLLPSSGKNTLAIMHHFPGWSSSHVCEALRIFSEREAQIHCSSYRPVILIDSIISNTIALLLQCRNEHMAYTSQ